MKYNTSDAGVIVNLEIICTGLPTCNVIANKLSADSDAARSTTCRCNGGVEPTNGTSWGTAGNNCTNYGFTHSP